MTKKGKEAGADQRPDERDRGVKVPTFAISLLLIS